MASGSDAIPRYLAPRYPMLLASLPCFQNPHIELAISNSTLVPPYWIGFCLLLWKINLQGLEVRGQFVPQWTKLRSSRSILQWQISRFYSILYNSTPVDSVFLEPRQTFEAKGDYLGYGLASNIKIPLGPWVTVVWTLCHMVSSSSRVLENATRSFYLFHFDITSISNFNNHFRGMRAK